MSTEGRCLAVARRRRARVTGQQQYVADIHLPGELHAKLVTLPVARARIISIDTAAARCRACGSSSPPPIYLSPCRGTGLSSRIARSGSRRDEVPRRARGRGGGRNRGRGRGGRAPGPGRVRGATGPLHDRGRPRPGGPARPGSRPPAGRPARRTNVMRVHRVGWGDVDADGRTSSSRTATASRW